jgi:hypothetical protein
MELFAWIGDDEFGSGEVGLKQALTPAGCIPLVAIERDQIDRVYLRRQLQAQADQFGVRIRLARFVLVEDEVHVCEPRRV